MSPQRSRWHWLADLVDLPRSDRPALRDALTWLGFSETALVEGIAAILDVTPQRLVAPDDATVARVDPQRLAAVLPRLLDDERAALRSIGERWLSCPAAAYQLPPALVEGWMRSTGTATTLLRARIEREGLALLGGDALRRLAKDATDAAIREAAQRWVARFS